MKKNIKILYIEDDPETRSLMADIMNYHGFQFFEADRGITGIRLAKKIKPDLIIIDLLLPDMEGYEVTTLLKSIDEVKDIPIIALTAQTIKDVKELTLAAGCDGFISKPINVNEFLHHIEEYLAGRRDHLSDNQQNLYLKKYNVLVVEKLAKKIIELETVNENLSHVNEELLQSKEELARYNDRLFYLNNLANFLRKRENPEEVLKILPQKTIDGFKLRRCIVFRYDKSASKLEPQYIAGIDTDKLKNKKIPVSSFSMENLKEQGGLIWFRNINEISEAGLDKFAQQVNSNSFILSKLNDLASRSDSTQVLKAVTEPDHQQELPENYVLFLDKGIEEPGFATYEVRILKSFIQSVGTIYENMLLYHSLFETYKISERQAVTDELTRIYNYRYVMRELERDIDRAKRYGTCFSLIMFDIDHFKNYNDLNGHPAGDNLLKKMSQLVLKNTRKTDTFARYGGEEFLIILPGLTKKKAIPIARKIKKLVEDEDFPFQETQPLKNVTISLGLASYPEDSLNVKGLLEKADKALYLAKNEGRNKIIAFKS